MGNTVAPPSERKCVYSVWGIPSEEVSGRLRKLMETLQSEFNAPQFEPHVTVVGAIALTEADAVEKLRLACEGLSVYECSVDRVGIGRKSVHLLLHPTAKVVETSAHCSSHFGYKSSIPYWPHLSILYGEDLTDEEMKKAAERAISLEESINSLNFQITSIALYETDTEDKTLKSWEKIAECFLNTN